VWQKGGRASCPAEKESEPSATWREKGIRGGSDDSTALAQQKEGRKSLWRGKRPGIKKAVGRPRGNHTSLDAGKYISTNFCKRKRFAGLRTNAILRGGGKAHFQTFRKRARTAKAYRFSGREKAAQG